MKTAVLLTLLVAAVAARSQFDNWVEEHGKVYSSWDERALREKIWTKNLYKILAHNIQHLLGESTYRLGMNAYGDLTPDEFRAYKTCFGSANTNSLDMPKIKYHGSTFLEPINSTLPYAIDFRIMGFVTKVKNQGQCGSCWAFSTTGSLEGQWFRKTGKLVSLSEQQLVDCSGKFGNEGCDGGLMRSAMTYIMSTSQGLEKESAYPYTGEDGECVYRPKTGAVKATGFLKIPAGNETLLTMAIAANGPVSVAIDASAASFQFYESGVYYEPDCSSTELDHGVLAVGYGSLGGKDYYIVKNSWGASWGMDGYILMSRNAHNQCGIATESSLPLV